ncbi:MAG: phosphatidylserine decarboxylase family protein [Candidatus Zixiibacteriota bacterium]
MIARDGWTLILVGFLLTIVALWAATRWDSRGLFAASVVLAIATLFTVYFFRDPERAIPSGSNLLVAPADGRVVKIDTLANHQFVGERTIQVSIFLSVFDVHVNRVPCSGRIEYVKRNPGKFIAAFKDKASEENEQTEIGMLTQTGRRIAFKQIAGVIARRIVCRLSEGTLVSSGDRFGMIKFGSRADLLLPADTKVTVKVGDHVQGGTTIMGCLGTATPASASPEPPGRDRAQL